MSFIYFSSAVFFFILAFPLMIMSIYLIPILFMAFVLLTSTSIFIYYLSSLVNAKINLIRLSKLTACKKSNFAKTLTGNFQSHQLQKADLTKFKFQNMSFDRSNLSSIHASNFQIKSSTLRNTTFKFAYLSNCKIYACNLDESNFANANISKSSLFKSRLSKSNFESVNLSQSNLQQVIADHSWFKGANLKGSRLDRASFKGSNFCASDLSNCSTEKTIFQDAIFDNRTKLPFSFENAILAGMKYVPKSLKDQLPQPSSSPNIIPIENTLTLTLAQKTSPPRSWRKL